MFFLALQILGLMVLYKEREMFMDESISLYKRASRAGFMFLPSLIWLSLFIKDM